MLQYYLLDQSDGNNVVILDTTGCPLGSDGNPYQGAVALTALYQLGWSLCKREVDEDG